MTYERRSENEVLDTINGFFEAAREKDMDALADAHGHRNAFTKFDAFPPYTLQSSDTAIAYEEAVFANISDLKFKVEDPHVTVVGETAVAAFFLKISGIFVYDHSFEGRPVDLRLRATMVLAREEGRWIIIHEHLSELKDMKGEASPAEAWRPGW
jgi:ketosteroid isomerase-like protein